MGRENKDALIICATEADLREFAKGRHPGPSLEYFYPDAYNSRKSPWNRALAAIFARNYVDDIQNDCKDIALVTRVFSVHLQSIAKQHNAQLRRSEREIQAASDQQSLLSAGARRRTVSEQQHFFSARV